MGGLRGKKLCLIVVPWRMLVGVLYHSTCKAGGVVETWYLRIASHLGAVWGARTTVCGAFVD